MLTDSRNALLPVYAQFPLVAVSGKGSWLTDTNGQRWLDAYGGHAVASTGHSHPHVVQAIARQAEALMFYSTVLHHPLRQQLAELLVAHLPQGLNKTFFCNSGAEANENALTLARKRTGRSKFLSVTGSWHGRTVATLAVTDGAKYEATAQRAAIPVSQKVRFNDVASLAQAFDGTIAGLILEPVQGMAGAHVVSKEFLQAARDLCTQHGAALIFDEVQSGVGRTGAFTGAQLLGVTPDALTLAKGLGSGFPIGAIAVGEFLSKDVTTGDLGSTFGGGPMACAAAIATLEVIDSEGLVDNAKEVGEHIRHHCERRGLRVDGSGMLLGLNLGRPAQPVQKALFDRRILTGTASDPNVLRLMPPLNFSIAEADLLLAALDDVLFGATASVQVSQLEKQS